MDHQAERLLRSFADAAKNPTLSNQEWQLLYQLATRVHRKSIRLSGLMLTFRLIAQGVSQERAERFGTEFDHYRDLLALYDRERV